MYDAALTSLAILKVNWDRGTNYIECFVPFIVECIRQSPDDAISLPSLQEELKNRFAIDMPQNPLKMVLTRALKRRFLRKESGVLYRNIEQCAKIGFREKQAKVEATYDHVIEKLQQYAKTQHNIEWSAIDASGALHTFLRDNSLSLLFTIAEGGIYPNPGDRSGRDYIVGSFIAEAQKSDRQLVEDMVVLLQGNLLLNALYLPDPGRVSRKFFNTQVFLDTSIILCLVGFAGPARAAPRLELTALLKQYDASLRCFNMTYKEIQGILDACAANLHRGGPRSIFGPSMEYFVETGRTASDVELLAARLPQKLRDLTISIQQKPPYEDVLQIDEKGFEDTIESAIGYANPRARLHDVDCISAIARLRRGQESCYPEECKALFITSNITLAQATNRFFRREASSGAVALCMTDYALGNLLWLKNPTIAPDLPKKQLLAQAYAAMQPSEQLWKKYLTEITRLQEGGRITTDDYYLLRYLFAAKGTLMDLTNGDDELFTEGTVPEVLEIAKERLRADLQETVHKEQNEKHRLEEELQKRQERDIFRCTTLRSKAANISKFFCRSLLLVGAVLVIFGIGYTFPWSLPHLGEAWFRYLLAISLLIVFFLSSLSLIRGFTLKSILAKIEQTLADKLGRWFLNFAGLPGGEEDRAGVG
jgi:hypothetical protein